MNGPMHPRRSAAISTRQAAAARACASTAGPSTGTFSTREHLSSPAGDRTFSTARAGSHLHLIIQRPSWTLRNGSSSALRRLGCVALAACLLAPAGACGRLEAGDAGVVVFRDDFNGENGMVARANYDKFAQWEVAAGSVDLIGTYPFEMLGPGHGMYVDLDGATNHGARFRTRQALPLTPGDYLLSFSLAGCQRVSDPNTVHVSLGAVYLESFTLSAYTPLRRYVRRMHVARPVSLHIEFTQDGGDNFGALLDDVELVRVRDAAGS